MLQNAADAATAADWLEAWATLAGALLSGAAVLVALRVIRKEQGYRREDKLDADAVQARHIRAEFVKPVGTAEEGATGFLVAIVNSSDSRISDVEIWTGGMSFFLQNSISRVPEVAAQAVSEPVMVRFADPRPWPHDPSTASPAYVAISFIDAKGLKWTRNSGQEPRRLTTNSQSDDALRNLVLQYLQTFFTTRRARRVKSGLELKLREFFSNRLQARQRRLHPGRPIPRPGPPHPSPSSSNQTGRPWPRREQ